MSGSTYPTLAGSLIDVERQPIYDTIVQRESNGRELRVARQGAARYRYRIRYDFLRQDYSGGDEFAILANFFATHRGSWDSFLFEDPKNSTATTYSFGTGDGTTTVFYLTDEMGDRIAATPTVTAIYKAGVLQTLTTHYTKTTSEAKITFVTAPGVGEALTWSGTFQRRVRFASDTLSVSRRVSRVWMGNVELVSVLP